MLNSLLYVSRRTADTSSDIVDVADIVAFSRQRNARLDLTGALVATPDHYAQILEGKPAAVEEVMVSINRDARHRDLLVAPVERKHRRDFERWTLAYHGESTYVSQLVAAALAAPGFQLAEHAANLRSLIAMFA